MNLQKLEQLMKNRHPSVIGIRHAYAVLVPLVEIEGKLHLLYEVRSESLRRQPGEVCFPGGKLEPGETPEEGALREAEEELGIPSQKVKLLGPLDYMHHQGVFVMYPFLGVISQETYESIVCNEAEVKEIFLTPLSYLAKHPPFVYEYQMIPDVREDFPYEKIRFTEGYSFSPGIGEVPIYEYQNHVIWGITGRITRSFLQTMGVKQ
ncbi:MAG: CoA pyrophosphatase [Oscillospiraceae bacterium]|jgi:coenzyme A diphosphatase NUDT7|nr:CoA pyrophosphatase [Oscillospiraceae bacterium]